MAAIDELKTYLTGKPGVNITEDLAPDSLTFSINHSTGLSRKSFMAELMKHKVWIISQGVNSGVKTYKVALTQPSFN